MTDINLPKTVKLVEVMNTTPITSNTYISYNGNKIVKAESEQTETLYTYTGENITKEEEFQVVPNRQKKYEIVYTYLNNKLKTLSKKYFNTDGTINQEKGETIEKIYNSNGDLIEYIRSNKYKAYDGVKTQTYKTVLTKKSDGSINFEEYDITVTPQKTSTGKLTFSNNNLVKIEQKNYDFNNLLTSESITDKTYDNENSMIKNILGLKQIIGQYRYYGLENMENNLISKTTINKIYNNGSLTSESTNTYTKTITYNKDNYPIKIENDKKTMYQEITY